MSTKDEINALIKKAHQFLLSARLLRDHGDLASAASRLYYAMFYCAEALLLTKGLSYSKHGGVIAAFGQQFVKAGELPQEMHQWLISAFEKRQTADYEPQPVLTEADVTVTEKQAARFLTITENFLRQQNLL